MSPMLGNVHDLAIVWWDTAKNRCLAATRTRRCCTDIKLAPTVA
jgi:hypothetical protein